MKRKKDNYPKSHEEEIGKAFWARVNIKEGEACWNWTGHVARDGYGRFYFEGKVYITHRLAYVLEHGEAISRNILVIQTCKNKKCCNPSHFEISTRKKQLEGMAKHGRVRGFAQRGENNYGAKLTRRQVGEIIKKFNSKNYSKAKLGREYGISRGYVTKIVTGVWWKWLKKIDK